MDSRAETVVAASVLEVIAALALIVPGIWTGVDHRAAVLIVAGVVVYITAQWAARGLWRSLQ